MSAPYREAAWKPSKPTRHDAYMVAWTTLRMLQYARVAMLCMCIVGSFLWWSGDGVYFAVVGMAGLSHFSFRIRGFKCPACRAGVAGRLGGGWALRRCVHCGLAVGQGRSDRAASARRKGGREGTAVRELPALLDAIRSREGCAAEWRESVEVLERDERKTLWEGDVQVFDLVNHREGVKRAYAWSLPTTGTERRLVVVPEKAPVRDAATAVRASIAAVHRRATE